MKNILQILLFVSILVISKSSYSQSLTADDIDYDKVYEEISNTFQTIQAKQMQEMIEKEDPAIFLEIDALYGNMENHIQGLVAKKLKEETGLDINKMTKSNQNKYAEKIKNIDMESVMKDPKTSEYMKNIYEKINITVEQNLLYMPKSVRDQMRSFASSSSSENTPLKSVQKYLNNNKDKITEALKKAIETRENNAKKYKQ